MVIINHKNGKFACFVKNILTFSCQADILYICLSFPAKIEDYALECADSSEANKVFEHIKNKVTENNVSSQ